MAKLPDGEERVQSTTKKAKPKQPKFRYCSNCNGYFDISLIETIDGKPYCPTCAAPILKRIEKDKQSYKELMAYLKELNDGDTSYHPMYAKQIKRLREDEYHPMKVSGIQKTLEYMFTIHEPKVEFYPDNVLNMIPKYYPIAEQYYREIYEVEKANANYRKDQDEEVVITISRKELEEQDRIYREKKKSMDLISELKMEDIEITEEDLMSDDDEYIG